MPSTTLHLQFDPVLGMCLWAHTTGENRRARPLSQLGEAAGSAALVFGNAIRLIDRPFRHRCDTAQHSRVPALQLRGGALAEVVDAARAHIRKLGEQSPSRVIRSEGDVDALIAEVAASHKPLTLSPGLLAGADFLAVVNLASHARSLVQRRLVMPKLEAAHGSVSAIWTPAPGAIHSAQSSNEVLNQLVDSHARVAWAAVRAQAEQAKKLPDPDVFAAQDPVGSAIVDALGLDALELTMTPPDRQRIQRVLAGCMQQARHGFLTDSARTQLVVRVWEDSTAQAVPTGLAPANEQDTSWLIEACIRDDSGLLHTLADLVSVGDLTTVDALQYAARIRAEAPLLSELPANRGGTAWSVGTQALSRFLGVDAVALELAGITVLLPREWTKQSLTLKATVAATGTAQDNDQGEGGAERSQSHSSGLKAAMARFQFSFSVGHTDLSPSEIQEILDNQRELVKLRGQWVRLDSKTLKAAEKFLDAFSKVAWARDPKARTWMLRKELAGGAGKAVLGSDGAAGKDVLGGDGATEQDVIPGAGLAGEYVLPGAGPAGTGGAGSDAAFEISVPDYLAVLGTEGLDGLDMEVLAAPADTAESSPTGIETLFGARAELPSYPHPQGLKASLRPYQKRGLDWLTFLDMHALGGILADDMGLGKTMQVLSLLVREREDPMQRGWGNGFGGPTLLVCPMSVLGSWQREAKAWAPEMKVHVHHGPERLHGAQFQRTALAADLVLTTYALVSRDYEDLSGVQFHRVILDEAQHVKNADTQVARAVRALPAGRRLALTGTPVENDLTDLHSILSITNPGLLPVSEKAFKERFADPINDGDEAAHASLVRITQPYILRRVKTDQSIISDLPLKREERVFVNITPEQAGLYQALVDDLDEQLGALSGQAGKGASELKKRSIISGTLMKMKQVLNHPAHYLADGSPIMNAEGEHRSGKLERVDDLLSAAFANREKVLIFTQFTAFAPAMIEHWRKTFGIEASFLHGGISKAERDELVRDFQNTPQVPGVMLLSLRAGGTGITLTAANHVIHLDRWWNPAVENQATDRAFRIGQKKDVDVHKLIALGTIEEAIDNTLSSKAALAEATITSGESWLASLDRTALRSMFALRGEHLPSEHLGSEQGQ